MNEIKASSDNVQHTRNTLAYMHHSPRKCIRRIKTYIVLYTVDLVVYFCS